MIVDQIIKMEKENIEVKRAGELGPLVGISVHVWAETEGMQDTLPFHRIFGVAHGDAEVTASGEAARLEPGALVFVPRHTECRITAREGDTTIVACCIEGRLPLDTAALFAVLSTAKRRVPRRIPTLASHPGITECLRGIEVLRELARSKEWCELKLRELILVAGLCRGKGELEAGGVGGAFGPVGGNGSLDFQAPFQRGVR